MRNRLIASIAIALAGALAVPAVAIAEAAEPAAAPAPFTGNFTLASEYIYRGIGQTNRKPAVQGGFDYAHASGLYIGVWGSNISWLSDQPGDISSSIEIDLYGGYKGSFGGDFSYDLGALRYHYPGSYPRGFVDADTGANPAIRIKLLAVAIDAKRTITQVLFFKFSQHDATLKTSEGQLSIMDSRLDSIRSVLAERVQPFLAENISKLDI